MKAVTITGEAVKRFQNDPPSVKSGNSLGFFVWPFIKAEIASTELMMTNSTARRNDMAELNTSLSTRLHKTNGSKMKMLVNNRAKILVFHQ